MDSLSIALLIVGVAFVLLFAMFMAGVYLVMRCVNEQGEASFVMLAGGAALLIMSLSGGAVAYQIFVNTDLDVIEALTVGSVLSTLVVTLMLLSQRIVTSMKRRKHGQKTP